jgi:hypothetical protein
METLDPVAVITALKQEVAAQSEIIKNALVLIQQFGARVASDKALIAGLEAQIAAVPDVTTTVQTDTKSLSDAIAAFSASGQLSV